MSASPLTSTPYFTFGETAEIQPPQPTASQTMPVSVTFPHSFVDPPIRANADDADFNLFTIPNLAKLKNTPIQGYQLYLMNYS